jgi:hypothetical protein
MSTMNEQVVKQNVYEGYLHFEAGSLQVSNSPFRAQSGWSAKWQS